MVRPAGWSSCGSSPTVLPSRRGRDIIGRQLGVTFESKLTVWKPSNDLEHALSGPVSEFLVPQSAFTGIAFRRGKKR